MVPYADMKLKGLPENIQIKTVTVAKEPSRRTANIFNITADKPIERKKSDDKIGKKEVVKYYDEENKDKREHQEKELSKEDEKAKQLQILASLKAEKGKFDAKLKPKKEAEKNPTPTPPPPSMDLEGDPLFGMGGMVSNSEWAKAAKVGSFEKA